MKDIPIKFRGCDINGQYVYGLLTMKKNRNSGKLSYAIAHGNFTQGETIPVSENSIAQLVGYDDNGDEVYKGDVVTAEDGMEFVATLEPKILWTNGAEKSLDFDFENVTLKK